MRNDSENWTKTETRALGLAALLCYAAALVAMLTCGYSLIALMLRTAGRDFAGLFYPGLM